MLLLVQMLVNDHAMRHLELQVEALEIWSVVLLICARIPDSARAEDFGMQTCWDGLGVNEFVL